MKILITCMAAAALLAGCASGPYYDYDTAYYRYDYGPYAYRYGYSGYYYYDPYYNRYYYRWRG